MRKGLAIKLRRVELDKKTTHVASSVGISREYYRLIEAGKATNPSTEIMKKIAKELKSDVLTLFFSDEEER
ncbi:helix-turn-helix transcriptional regulator [Clostridium butyricum]|uniref:helix-turn-helix transcriptional regulator n=1 Tax=Clostridium butyricum TaxID=1492 RepID=UPI0034653363